MRQLFILLAMFLVPLLTPAHAHEAHLHALENATGPLDSHTTETLIEYQIKHAAEILGGEGVLNFLGNLDPLTRLHLFGPQEQVLGVAVETFTKNLTPGMEYADVKRLQQFLNERGFAIAVSGPGSKGQETTYYGPATAAAVKRYQEAHSAEILKPNNLTTGTGLFLGSTREHINKALNVSSQVKQPSTTSPAASTGTTEVKNSTQVATKTYTLTVRRTGSGIITTSNGLTCSTDTCVFVIAQGAKITLTAVPFTGGKFTRFTGGCRTTRTTCNITMSGNKSVTAAFRTVATPAPVEQSEDTGHDHGGTSTPTPSTPTPVNYMLTAAVSGAGSITGTGINCGSDCTESFASGSSVTLTARPSSGYNFAGWSGACSGTATTCVVRMTSAQTASASFTQAPVAPAPTPAPAPVVGGVDKPTPNPYNPSFEPCSPLYSGGCNFVGLRDIRYGNESRWITREYLDFFPGWECNPSFFGTTAQAGDRCEVATIAKTGTLAAPLGAAHANMPNIDLTAIPLGVRGLGTLNIESTTNRGTTSDIGAFRIPCAYSHMAFIDPIVYPGQPGRAHLHTFFGNTAITSYSTASSLASSGNSTCPGGIANRSAYWVPSMIDTATNKPLIPNGAIWYYKTGYLGVTPASVQPMPAGLRLIAGALATATAAPPQWEAKYRWHCETATGQHNNYGLTIPNCAVGDKVAVEIFFPQCWDGVNLDSSDHRSHMAYAHNGCPSSHPVPLPELSLNISWRVETTGQARNMRLSSDMNGNPAGVTMHADFFEAWQPSIKQAFVENCLNESKDCNAYLLGDGRTLGEER
jgi:peptidoglycan hydrolase-like protein with peptidoglycan-binding domain